MSPGIVVDRETITAAFEALNAAIDTVTEMNVDALTTPEHFALLESIEEARRRLPAAEHASINHLAQRALQRNWAGSSPMR